jgi:hypothetical protein
MLVVTLDPPTKLRKSGQVDLSGELSSSWSTYLINAITNGAHPTFHFSIQRKIRGHFL